MSLNLNMSDIEAADFDALPVGRYHVKLTDWDDTETRNPGKLPQGTPGINAEFTVQDGPYENRKLWTNFWIHERTLGILKSFLKATQEFSEDELESDSLQLDFDDLISTDIVVKVRQHTYNGEKRNDINGFQPYDEDSWEPMQKTSNKGGGDSLMP